MKFLPPRSNRLLAVEADEFSLRAAVVLLSRGTPVVECVADAKMSDPASALQSALGCLKTSRLPGRAVLLSSELVPAVLRLPLKPEAVRPWHQMQQLIRWELEAFVAQQLGPRSIGEILVCRGYLTDEQRDELREELQASGGTTGSSSLAEREFEQTLLERGWTNRVQLDECLSIQKRLDKRLLAEEDLVCGWSSQPATGAGAVDDENFDGLYPWLVCSISRRARQRWRQLFSERRIRLAGLYPLAGCSARLLPPDQMENSAAVIDVRPGWIGLTRTRQRCIDAVQLQPVTRGAVSAQQCLDTLNSESADVVWLSGPHPDLAKLRDELACLSGRDVRLLETTSSEQLAGTASASLNSMIGAVCDARRKRNTDIQLSSVLPRDPAPPASRQPRTWWAAAVCLTGLVLGTLEFVALPKWYLHADSQATKAEQDLDRLESVAAEIEQRTQEIGRIESAIRENQGKFEEAQQKRLFLEVSVARRVAFIPSLLDAVALTAPDEVAINRISESASGMVEIEIWSLSDSAAQRYVHALSSRLGTWGVVIHEQRVQSKTGRLELPGYLLQLSLRQSEPISNEAPISEPSDSNGLGAVSQR